MFNDKLNKVNIRARQGRRGWKEKGADLRACAIAPQAHMLLVSSSTRPRRSAATAARQ